MTPLPPILDMGLQFNVWQVNGSIYGPYTYDDIQRFNFEGKLKFPTRLEITETGKRPNQKLLEYFGTINDIFDLFGPNMIPKRLSDFKKFWPLPDILPNPALYRYEKTLITFNLTTFFHNNVTEAYCPFITGYRAYLSEDQILPLSSIVELARRLLIDYCNLDKVETAHFRIILSEVFSPRLCDVCHTMIPDTHGYMIHALSVLHLENACIKYRRNYTIDNDYLRLRRLLDGVKRNSFMASLASQLATKNGANQSVSSSNSFHNHHYANLMVRR